MKMLEFWTLIGYLCQSEDPIMQYGVPALLAFQYHMIGRVDDCCGWKKENLGEYKKTLKSAAKVDLHGPKTCLRSAWFLGNLSSGA